MGDVIYGRLQGLNAKNAIHCNFSGTTRFHIFFRDRLNYICTLFPVYRLICWSKRVAM